MNEAVAAVLQLDPSDEFTTRLYLPRKFGGLGLSKHDGMATEKNQILSRMAFLDFLAIYYPPEYQFTNNLFNRNDIRLGTQEALQDHTGLTDAIMLSLVNPTARSTLATAKTRLSLEFEVGQITLLPLATTLNTSARTSNTSKVPTPFTSKSS
jgi:hypothetical protein